ncbi:hypothetical protein [Acinetobacter baumannii]|uniref:hypothetical protein n=1 Tax=Acinetobacter baumannii TaxID=470 RepID=UPI0027421A94|nr:hypothetical protein [Acinetobacter baumannii]MDP7851017.1 hypothetical protein [Acinetobacter baumannii]
MSNSIKVLISNLKYDNLNISSFLLAASSFFMLNLFSLATVSSFDLLPFDDIIGANSNVLFTYFLDFSGVISSVLLVAVLVLFILFQLMMLSFYMNTHSNRWLVLIVVAAIGFYGWVSIINPTIQKIEDKYLTSYMVGSKVYSDQYQEAYGIVGDEKLTDFERAYMNAQISADQMKQYPTPNNELLLNADMVQLDSVLSQNEDNAITVDSDVIYKLYEFSGENEELKSIKSVKNSVDRKAYMYAVLMAIFYILAFYNIYLFRNRSGM